MSARRLLAQQSIGAVMVALAVFWSAGAAAAELVSGEAIVVDGDTVELDGRAFDLYGIDAPELGQRCALKGKLFDCGDIARAALLDLTAGSRLSCRPLDDAKGTAICTAGGYDVGAGMVYTGWALADPARPKRYRETQAGAETAKRGLWRGRFIEPWDWRGGKRLEQP